MGTRGLTAVMVEGKYVIAQYNQWDSYPSGQGETALEFCRKHLRTQRGRDKFKARIAAHVKFSQDEKELENCTFEREVRDFTKIFEATDAGKKLDKAPTKTEQYMYCGRDNGANILNLVWDAPEGKTVYLQDEIAFAGDSLFCEWAYVIDLDAGTLEVFKGFNTKPIGEDERFKAYFKKLEHRKENQYWPVSLLRKYELENLPVKSVFTEELDALAEKAYETQKEKT